MKKKALVFLIVTFIAALFCIPCLAGTEISESEIKALVLKAHNFYFTYQDGINDFRIHSSINTTKDAVAKEAREIYVDEIADSMWMYQCSRDKNNPDQYNDGLTFVENSDGTITTISFIPQSIRSFFIIKEYSFDSWYKKESLPISPNNIRIRNIKSSDSGAYAEILMFHLTGYEAHIVPIWVSVELQNTKDGMRISGGNVIYAFSNWYDSSFSFVKDDEDVFVGIDYMDLMLSYALFKNDPDYFFNNGYDPNIPVGRSGKWKMILFDSEKCVYLVENTEDGNYYDVIFSRKEDGSVWFTGGGWYDLAMGKTDVSPYTKDGNCIYLGVAVMLSALSATALLSLIRKKNEAIK